jgi:hypothetical protein
LIVSCAWLWLAFTSRELTSAEWLPGAFLVGLLALLVGLLVVYPRRPRQLSLAVLVLLGAYTLWVAASALWASSPARVWPEAVRTGAFFLVFALALAALTNAAVRRVFRYLFMAAAAALLAGCIGRLWWPMDTESLFLGARLAFPAGYPNGSAALFLIPFWPLIWLAAAPGERAPVRGIALGLATGLVALAVLTQSRAAVYSLVVTMVVVFIISPHRLRTLLYLIAPGLLLVYVFPNLNRYWAEGGPAAVGGGGPAARTVLVASLTAGFIGMIVALLERWIPASRRMKAIFGCVVLAGALAGLVYGSIVLTRDLGGPGAWLSQAWQRFTGLEQVEPEAEQKSRLTVVSTGGSVEVWRVAWNSLGEEPWLGSGAGNFTFVHDRLRTNVDITAQEAHSLELQVLSETGIVGGALLGLTVVFTLGGAMWGRSVASWRRARRGWLHRPGRAQPAEDGPCDDNARWGNDPQAYGWEMALFAGLTYWFIHASLDRLWQLTAVAIPALLLLAALLAAIDARVGTMWPRWERLLRRRADRRNAGILADIQSTEVAEDEGAQGMPGQLEVDSDDGAGDATCTEVPRRHPGSQYASAEGGFTIRRSDQYMSKWRKRRKRELRRRRSLDRIRPAGAVSAVFRYTLIVLGALVLVTGVFPYVSARLEAAALAVTSSRPSQAADRAEKAHWLYPGHSGPLRLQGMIFLEAAETAALGTSPDRAGAVIDDLALALAALDRAVRTEPADWSTHYDAAVVGLNLLIARSRAVDVDGLAAQVALVDSMTSIPGLKDWSALAMGTGIPTPGESAGSLWPAEDADPAAVRFRAMDGSKLVEAALAFLAAAESRNPLSVEVAAALRLAERLKDATSEPASG